MKGNAGSVGGKKPASSEPFPPGWKIEPATGCTPNSQVPEPVACLYVCANFVTRTYGCRQVPPAGGCTPDGRDTASSFRRKRHASRCHCSYVPRNTSRVVITGPRELQTPVLAAPELLTRYSRRERRWAPKDAPHRAPRLCLLRPLCIWEGRACSVLFIF